MSELTQITARIDVRLKKALDLYCRANGLILNHFIQEALIDRLEEMEDISELKNLLQEPTRLLSEVLEEL